MDRTELDKLSLDVELAPLDVGRARRPRRGAAWVAAGLLLLAVLGVRLIPRERELATPTAAAALPAPAPEPTPPRAPAGSISAAAETFLHGGAIHLAAGVGGRLVETPFEVGDAVRRGDVVARLDEEPYHVAEQGALADLRVARAERELAEGKLARMQALYARGVISDADRENARAGAEVARARVAQLESRLAEVRRRRRECHVESPIDGIVTERFLHVGEWAKAGEVPILQVADLARIRVQVFFAESDLPHVQAGRPVEVELNALGGRRLRGRITLIDPVVDLARGTGRAEIELAELDPRIRPGMTGRAWLALEPAAAPDPAPDSAPPLSPAATALSPVGASNR